MSLHLLLFSLCALLGFKLPLLLKFLHHIIFSKLKLLSRRLFSGDTDLVEIIDFRLLCASRNNLSFGLLILSGGIFSRSLLSLFGRLMLLWLLWDDLLQIDLVQLFYVLNILLVLLSEYHSFRI